MESALGSAATGAKTGAASFLRATVYQSSLVSRGIRALSIAIRSPYSAAL